MANNLLKYTMFHPVFFPKDQEEDSAEKTTRSFQLRRSVQYFAHPESSLRKTPFVVFDFETTGLSPDYDRIIEIGAQKIVDFKVVDEFSTLVAVKEKLSAIVLKLTGISNEMLENQPSIDSALPKFLKFIEGSILVAHNATFDMAFLKAEVYRLGFDLEWSAFCSLKLARELLPELESKSLDSLAKHYQLEFEARHRSIGDVKVTIEFLEKILAEKGQHLSTWKDLKAFQVE